MSAKPGVLIRADASISIGTGHVMRCLALAQAWQERYGEAVFASAGLSPGLRDRLQGENVAFQEVVALDGPADYERTAKLAKVVGAEWVVLDGYNFGSDFQKSLQNGGLRVLGIDDYGHANHYSADVVLNQNLGADAALYADRQPHTRLLLGPRYALLRREFTASRAPHRVVSQLARKVLVTLGGADPEKVTLKVIQALQLVDVDGLEVIVVAGASNPHRKELEAKVRASPIRIELLTNVTEMPALMRWADVCVAAGGSTAWERAFLGLPSLVLVLAENQEAVASAMETNGAAWNLGWHHLVNLRQIADSVRRLLNDWKTRCAMASLGPELVDGGGAIRVVEVMTGRPRLRLRSACKEDIRLLWKWANDPVVRRRSFTPDPISWEGHQEWFVHRLSKSDFRIYIAENETGQPIGQIRFDRTSADAAEIDVSLAPEHRGHGYGAALIESGVDEVFRARWTLRANAYIRSENASSLAAFRKAGFTIIGEVEIKGQVAIHAMREACNG